MMAGYLVFGVALAGMLGVGWVLNADWRGMYRRLRPLLEQAPRPAPSAPNAKKTRRQDEY
jgi:hypothetical protein